MRRIRNGILPTSKRSESPEITRRLDESPRLVRSRVVFLLWQSTTEVEVTRQRSTTSSRGNRNEGYINASTPLGALNGSSDQNNAAAVVALV